MQNKVAILFEKKSIGKFSFAFIAINYIEGEETLDHKFISNGEMIYDNIQDSKALFTSEQYFYGYAITIEDLKRQFGSATKSNALIDYLYFFTENLIVGNLDNFGNMSIVDVNIEDFFYNKSANINLDKDIENIKKEIDLGNYKQAIELLKNKNSNTNTNSTKLNYRNKLDVKRIIDNVNDNVIGQEEAIDTIATTIALNYMNNNPKNHSNILVTGPTGVGKTEILNSIAKEINIPCVIADMSSITQEGYVGKSVDTLLAKVYNAANGDLNLAQRAILVLDEIDKKASKNNDDVAGRAVLNSLLKILDGNVIDVNIGSSQKPNYINFDTSHLTIVSIGAFTDLNNIEKNSIGFITNSSKKIEKKELYFKYGMPEEFMGRMSVIVNLNELSLDDYTLILLKSYNSPLLLKWDLLEEYGILFKPTESYICEIASKTVKLKAGARGLKIAVNESLQPALNEIVKNGTYKELLVDGETVHNPKKYILK